MTDDPSHSATSPIADLNTNPAVFFHLSLPVPPETKHVSFFSCAGRDAHKHISRLLSAKVWLMARQQRHKHTHGQKPATHPCAPAFSIARSLAPALCCGADMHARLRCWAIDARSRLSLSRRLHNVGHVHTIAVTHREIVALSAASREIIITTTLNLSTEFECYLSNQTIEQVGRVFYQLSSKLFVMVIEECYRNVVFFTDNCSDFL
jgi:hypothetical protein